MLIFDQLRKHDPRLRLIALVFVGGFVVLGAGLWWVQIVSVKDFQAHLEMQSFRTVRMPAVRGKILDRNGTVLAENRPVYNVSLYLEELRKDFDAGDGLARAPSIYDAARIVGEQIRKVAAIDREALERDDHRFNVVVVSFTGSRLQSVAAALEQQGHHVQRGSLVAVDEAMVEG